MTSPFGDSERTSPIPLAYQFFSVPISKSDHSFVRMHPVKDPKGTVTDSVNRYHLGHVFGDIGRIFPAKSWTRDRMSRHHDSGLAVHARFPGALGVNSAMAFVFLRGLTEVPDRSFLVLGIPIISVFAHYAVLADDIVDDDALHAHHDFRPACDGDSPLHRLALILRGEDAWSCRA